MVRTYVVEHDKLHQVFEYCTTLKQAKRIVVKYYDQPLSILALQGQYFGEGQHVYRYIYNASKIKFTRKNLR